MAMSSLKKTLKSLRRFSKSIFTHPGTWILGSLIAVGIGIATPAIAPALVLVALGCSIVAVPMLLWQGKNLWNQLRQKKLPVPLDDVKAHPFQAIAPLPINFIKAHPFQAIVIGLAVALLVTALVLTIGFFTGGVGFAFMASAFAAISAPFAAAATAGGIPLCLPALAGFCLTIAALNLPNTLKRFLSWLDSFKYDAAIDYAHDLDGQKKIAWSNKSTASEKVTELVKENGYYLPLLCGIAVTVLSGCSSLYEERLEAAREKIEAEQETEKMHNQRVF